MTKEEYKNKFDAINIQYIKAKNKLQAEYALSNNPYKIGDVIKDHKRKIKIEKIEVTAMLGHDHPICAYIGQELKKDGTPKKNGKKETIWQNVIKD